MNGQKLYFKLMDFFLPSLAAKQVYDVLSNPRIRKKRSFEEEVLDKAQKEIIPFRGFKIQTYSWGPASEKVVFLIHGWEGQAGNFGALVDILLEKGYQVKAFDGPSHGYSSKGKTNMFDFSDLVNELLNKYLPSAIISHSFGSVTSIMALSKNADIPIDKWIMVTTPHNFKNRINDIKDYLGVTERTMNKVVHKIESDAASSIHTMNMDYFGDRVNHVQDVLIVHSKADKVIPIQSARNAHAVIPHSRLIELQNFGHYSILWSEELKKIVDRELDSNLIQS